jgi:hypothetical protein
MKDVNEKRNRQRCKEETDTHRDENMMRWLETDSCCGGKYPRPEIPSLCITAP